MNIFPSLYIDTLRGILRNRKLFVVIGALSGIFALLSLFSKEFLMYFSNFINMDLMDTSIPITFLLISIFSFSLMYLQSGGKANQSSETEDEIYQQKKQILHLRDISEDSRVEIVELKKQLEKYQSENGLTAEEKQQIIDDTINKTSIDSIESIFKSEASKMKSLLEKSLGYEQLKQSVEHIKKRLYREIADLRLRSNINLLIGMSITAGGLYLLWTTVSMVDSSKLLKELASEGTESNSKFLKNLLLPLIPRIMLVIFVEIFAYFFLRLYKQGLGEIKYFQNELTNVESKLVALEFAYTSNNETGVNSVIDSLSKTERNFVLEKGQTTVELEKAKSESEMTKNILKAVPDLFKKN
jgi:hypothetical protein